MKVPQGLKDHVAQLEAELAEVKAGRQAAEARIAAFEVEAQARRDQEAIETAFAALGVTNPKAATLFIKTHDVNQPVTSAEVKQWIKDYDFLRSQG